MTHADLDAVLGIEAQAYEFPWSRGIFEDCLKAGYSCWVACEDDVIQAYVVVMAAVDEAQLLNICVSPSQQGQGVGRWLMGNVRSMAERRGLGRVLLEVRSGNLAAKALYESLGYQFLGLRKNYYPAGQGREDARVYALDV